MEVVFIGDGPYESGVFPFSGVAGKSALGCAAAIGYATVNSFTLPWQLHRLLGRGEDGEKVVIHTSSPRGVMAAMEMSHIRDTRPYTVFMPRVSAITDTRELSNLGKYASRCDLLLFQGSAERDVALKAWPGVEVRTEVLPPPVVEPQADAGEADILYHAPITEDCGLDSVIGALAAMPSRRLAVNGTGKGRWAMPMVKLSRRLGTEPRIAWMGDEHAGRILKVRPLTVVALTNAADDDAAVKIASYMAQGATVVAADAPVSRSLITDGVDGIILPRIGAAEVADAFNRADALPQLGEAAKVKAEGWSLMRFFENLTRIYRSL